MVEVDPEEGIEILAVPRQNGVVHPAGAHGSAGHAEEILDAEMQVAGDAGGECGASDVVAAVLAAAVGEDRNIGLRAEKSRGEENVVRSFGYGLSYTDFSEKITNIAVDTNAKTFTATVETSSEESRLARLRARGLSDEEARARIAAQLPSSERIARADFAILNDGTPDELFEKARELFRRCTMPNAECRMHI